MKRCLKCPRPVTTADFCPTCGPIETRRRAKQRAADDRQPLDATQTTVTLTGGSVVQQLTWWWNVKQHRQSSQPDDKTSADDRD